MSLELFAHPFSSYCQKVLTALWENGTQFTYRHMEEPGVGEALAARWPIGKFPILVRHHPGEVRLVPVDSDAAIEVRLLDRFFDQYVMNAAQVAVNEAIRKMRGRPDRLEEAKETTAQALEVAYRWLETRLEERVWAAGADFSMADCAAAPSLFYADWVHPIGDGYPWLRAYRARLLTRPSFALAVEEGRRYRHYFPLGAPDRD